MRCTLLAARASCRLAAGLSSIARQMIREMESEKGPVPVIGSPLRLADSPARFDRIPKLAVLSPQRFPGCPMREPLIDYVEC